MEIGLRNVNVVDKEEFFWKGVVGLGEGFVDGVWRWGSSDSDIVKLIYRGIESGWYLRGWGSWKAKQKCSKWLGEVDTCVKIRDDVLEITLGPYGCYGQVQFGVTLITSSKLSWISWK